MCGEVFVHLQEQLVMPQSLFPRRYYIDDDGRRVLIGLTVEQTREFELLELPEPSPGIDQASLNHGRWLELIGCTSRLGKFGEKRVLSPICPWRLARPLSIERQFGIDGRGDGGMKKWSRAWR
jgi:hypothetical protein